MDKFVLCRIGGGDIYFLQIIRIDIFVSSDDDEILMLAEKFGALIHNRPDILSTDRVTLDLVIYEAYKSITENGKNYELIVTIQLTSPLLKTSSLDEATSKMIQNQVIETMISARQITHLLWSKEGDHFVSRYEKRLSLVGNKLLLYL